MEIQKIFSNVEDPSENLYSVLLSEEELYLFSELQKEFSSKAQKELRRKWELGEAEKMGLKTTKPNGKVVGSSISEVRGRNNLGNVDKLAERQRWIEGGNTNARSWIHKDMRDNLSPVDRVKLAENNAARRTAAEVEKVRRAVDASTDNFRRSISNTSLSVGPNTSSKTSGAMNLLKKNKKALAIGGSLAAAGGIGYGIYKSRQNKE